MEQVSFRPVGDIKDQSVADSLTKWGRQLEYLFNVKLTGEDIHDSSVEGGKMVTVIDDRSTDLTFSPAAQASASTDPWYKFTNDFFYYDNTATQGDGALTSGAANPTFTRASVRYDENGAQIASGTPEYRTGKFSNGIHIEEGTTNLLTANQASVETDTTGFEIFASAAISRVTSEFWHGSASLKIAGTSVWYGGCNPGVSGSSGEIFVGSIWVKGVAGRQIDTYVQDVTNSVTSPLTSYTLTGSWQRISTSAFTLSANSTDVRLRLQNPTSTAADLYADGWQVEKKAYATSWHLPSDGARANETLTIPTAGALSATAGTIEGWIKLFRAPGTNAQYIFDGAGGANQNLVLYVTTAGKLECVYGTGAATVTITGTTTLVKDTLYHVAVKWASGGVTIYLNGASEGTNATAPSLTFGANAYLGSKADGTLQLDGILDDERISSRARTDAEILAVYNSSGPAMIDGDTTYKLPFDSALVHPTQTVEYVFTGTEVQVIAAKANNSGKIDIYIDGSFDSTVDCYAANALSRAVIYSKTGLPSGRHTINVQARVDKNASSSAYNFFFDGFRINTPLGLKQVEVGVMQIGLSLTTNGNGYVGADLVNYAAPSGYSSLGIAGARLVTPNPDTGSNKPKIGWDGRNVIFYDGPVSNTVQAWIFFIVMRS